MKRKLLIPIIALLIGSGILAPQALAQSPVEPTPTPEVEPPVEMPDPIPGTDYSLVQIVIVSLSVLLLGVIAVFGVTVVQFSRNALNSLPPWAIDRIRANVPPLLDQLDLLTDVPGTTLDDEARAALRKAIDEILAQNALRAQARALSGKE